MGKILKNRFFVREPDVSFLEKKTLLEYKALEIRAFLISFCVSFREFAFDLSLLNGNISLF